MKIKKLRMANSLLADILACNGFHAEGYATLKSDAPDDLKVIGVFHSDADGTTFIVESESFADVEFIHDAPLIVFSITAENYVKNLREELEAVVADRDDLLKRAELVAGWNEITTGLGETVKEMRAQLAAMTAERDALKAQLDAVPVKAIDFYFFHVDEEVAMIDADIPGNPEAMVNAAVQIGDWLNSTRR